MEPAMCVAFLGTSIGIWEILLILAIILLLFGASRIPEVARSLGKGVNEFKKGIRGEEPEKGPSKALDAEKDPRSIGGGPTP
jgi:sec-independent protein translocase protein TatA